MTIAATSIKAAQRLAYAALVLWPAYSHAQSPPPSQASVTLAMAKGITYKIATAVTWGVVGYAGSGALTGATFLAGATTVASYVVYVGNEYGWDYFMPPPAARVDGSFDAPASAWRNTWKFITFKPLVTSVNWSIAYLYTGSAAQALAMGTSAAIAITGVFYLNNMAWDWYEWHDSTAPAKQPQ